MHKNMKKVNQNMFYMPKTDIKKWEKISSSNLYASMHKHLAQAVT